MHYVKAKSILTAKPCGMNIYRGCTHGCIYCDSRSTCYRTPVPFEDIEVKQNAVELLEEALCKKRKKCMVGTGAMSDPYMHCEKELQMTRVNVLKFWNATVLAQPFRQNPTWYCATLI